MRKFDEAAKKIPQVRTTTVQSVQDITPHMRRIVFEGPELAGFPQGKEGGYIKLLLPGRSGSNLDSPVMRTYSVRAQVADAPTLTVDFALHPHTGGIAMNWVSRVRIGEEIQITGPGTVKMAPADADWYLIAADMTGQPAAMCNLEILPDDARGYAIFEIPTEADKQEIDLPGGMKLKWVVNPHPEELNGALLGAIKACAWLDGDPFVWTACEFDTMRALRTYYRRDRNLGKGSYYLSSYWRAGRSEDQHKIDKSKDAQDNASLARSLVSKIKRRIARVTGR